MDQGATARPFGFFLTPNRLFAEGCRRPVALAVYARLAATAAVWTARGDLEPFEVRASLTGLMAATGASHKEVRGALGWLVRGGFLERRKGEPRATAVYRIVQPGAQQRAQSGGGVSDGGPTASGPPPKGEGHSKGHRLAEKGTAKGTARGTATDAVSNGKPTTSGVIHIAKGTVRGTVRGTGIKDVEDNYLPPPPPTAPEGVVGLWYEAHGDRPPPEPKAKASADRYRAVVLGNATAGETVEDVRRMFASWVAGTDRDWRKRGDSVTDFASAAPRWIEARNAERKARAARGGDLRPLIEERKGDGTASSENLRGAGGLGSVS